jgi:ABC-2 type transport system ATP-binding protein
MSPPNNEETKVPLIVADQICRYYGDFVAVEDVSFSVNKGEIVGLLGPNGAGKTTVMRTLTGFMPPSSGAARIAGFDTVEEAREARSRVGYLPEAVPLYSDMTVRQYLLYMGTLNGLSGLHLKHRVEATAEAVQTRHVLDMVIGKLSKGYRQRVGIAQAILHEPPVLILDEPTTGIDPTQVVQTRELIRSLGDDHTVLLSTHILSEVSMLCDRVIIIHEGRIIADGNSDELAARLTGNASVEVQVRGAQTQVTKALSGVTGVVAVTSRIESDANVYIVEAKRGTDVVPEIARVIVDGGWGLLRLQPASLTLEQVYMQLTEETSIART